VALLVSPQTWCVLILILFLPFSPPSPCPSFFFFLSPLGRGPRVDGAFIPHFITYANTQRNAHQEEYFALDDAELRHVISILKLLALGAHKVCRALHVSSFAYDSLSHLLIKFPLFFLAFFSLSFWPRGCGAVVIFGPSTSPTNFVQRDTHEP
jgi:hypothetical protein